MERMMTKTKKMTKTKVKTKMKVKTITTKEKPPNKSGLWRFCKIPLTEILRGCLARLHCIHYIASYWLGDPENFPRGHSLLLQSL